MLWQSPQSFPKLELGQVHVWRVPLICSDQQLAMYKSILNEQENKRAKRFIVDYAANNFIVARGVLKTLVGKYLSLNPKQMVFEQGEYGKLYLKGSPLQFNLSHSGDLSLFIFALDHPVGIDVELIRDDCEYKDIVNKFFSEQEIEDLFNLPKEQQLSAFFNCWSRKEAFIKGLGVGIFKELHSFSIEISSKKTGKIKLISSMEDRDWSLESLDPGSKYAGALAVKSLDYSANFYDFPWKAIK